MATSEDDHTTQLNKDHEDETLEYIISIWPVASKIATYLPAGDLLSLSRSSVALRLYTHGFSRDFRAHPTSSIHPPNLHIGEHQTKYWASLKALSPFICSYPSHKEPKSAKSNLCRPCKFCCRPICKTCIIRSFFTDPKSSKLTYKYRARHLCSKCWDTGNLRKDFRYPADCVSREQVWQGRGYAQRGSWCGCSASDDNWVCGECRVLQNTSGISNNAVSLTSVAEGKMLREPAFAAGDPEPVRCYGLECNVMISEIDRDRRRVCLWCSKPLMRPYGGDDRLRWEEKQIEIRAAAAASRSADIYEWARNRFKTLTMSRRELRGTEACIELTGSDGPEHDQPTFVRHLDTINYRQYISQRAVPSGDEVYQSKHGRWTYSRAFLSKFNNAVERSEHSRAFSLPSRLDLKELFLLNADMGLPGARTNSHPHFEGNKKDSRNVIIRYGAQLQNAGLLDQDCLAWLCLINPEPAAAVTELSERLFAYLERWENLSEEGQLRWTPPSFWYICQQSGLLDEAKKDDGVKRQQDGKQAGDEKRGNSGHVTDQRTEDQNNKGADSNDDNADLDVDFDHDFDSDSDGADNCDIDSESDCEDDTKVNKDDFSNHFLPLNRHRSEEAEEMVTSEQNSSAGRAPQESSQNKDVMLTSTDAEPANGDTTDTTQPDNEHVTISMDTDSPPDDYIRDNTTTTSPPTKGQNEPR